MPKIKLSLIAVLLIAFVFNGCQKQPTAKITTDKTQYVAGETVRLTSITSDADSYRWTWPDGQTSTAKNLDYATADNTGNATKTFKLEVFSKNGKKHDEASKNITIVAATGNVTFWNTSSSSPDFVEVTINETTKEIKIRIDQVQADGSWFKMPVQVAIYSLTTKKPMIKTLQVNQKQNEFTIPFEADPESIVFDPDNWVLMDVKWSKN